MRRKVAMHLWCSSVMWLLIHFPRNYVMIQKLNTLRNAFWNDTIPLPFPMHMLIGSSSQIWIFLACQFHPVSTLHLTCGKCLVGLGPAANWAISVLQLLGRWTCPAKNKLQQLCLGASTLENKKNLGGHSAAYLVPFELIIFKMPGPFS